MMRVRNSMIAGTVGVIFCGGVTAMVSAASDAGNAAATSAYPKSGATINEAYSVFARDHVASDETKNLGPETDSRKALPNVYLYRENGDLCVAAKFNADFSGASCSYGAAAAGSPPVLVYQSKQGDTGVSGAAPDGVESVSIVDDKGQTHTVPTTNNGFILAFAGSYASGVMTRSDRTEYELPSADE